MNDASAREAGDSIKPAGEGEAGTPGKKAFDPNKPAKRAAAAAANRSFKHVARFTGLNTSCHQPGVPRLALHSGLYADTRIRGLKTGMRFVNCGNMKTLS